MTEKEVLEATEQEREREVDRATSDFMAKWSERRRAHLGLEESEELAEEQLASEKVEQEQESKRPFQSLRKSLRSRTNSAALGWKAEAEPQQSEEVLPAAVLWKSLPVLAISLAFLILSVYFISPFSKAKKLSVVGNHLLTVDMVTEYSLISAEDYALTTFLYKDAYAKNIELTSNLVKSAQIHYQFPNTFTIEIEEYKEIGYVKDGDNYHSVLSSGEISDRTLTSEELPQTFTVINMTDQALIKELAVQLGTIDASTLALIQTIDLTPSKVTTDLVTLTMADGHKVLVPISDMERKLPYYGNIVAQLSLPSTIDMEVGIFSYAS